MRKAAVHPAPGPGEILDRLKSLADPKAAEGMARYGISTNCALGVSIPKLRRLAKEIGRDHGLAGELWESGIHEARILATLVDDPALVTAEQMDRWARDFSSWDVCDQCCSNLFDKTRFAWDKAGTWARRQEVAGAAATGGHKAAGENGEYVRRAGFVLMAALAVHDKRATDDDFTGFFKHIRLGARDERNFVKKAVNWALRQIGKRSLRLNGLAVLEAERILEIDSRAARWIASDALRELKSDAIMKRLRKKRR